MEEKGRGKTAIKQNRYLISLYKSRSIVALVAGVLIVFCAFIAIAMALQNAVIVASDESRLFYFTTESNALSGLAAAFMIPYAIEGIRKKRFALPRWLVVFQYAGVSCVAITMVTAMLIILPYKGISAFHGSDFWLHLITPLLAIVLFASVETGIILKRIHIVIAQIPYWLYMTVYFVNVVIIGKENGGWNDFYHTTDIFPWGLSLILMLTIGLAVTAVMRLIHNKYAVKSIKRLTMNWGEHMDRTELCIEAFGLGRYMGIHSDYCDLVIPIDVFCMMADRYDVTVGELSKAFVKGAVDAIKERQAT